MYSLTRSDFIKIARGDLNEGGTPAAAAGDGSSKLIPVYREFIADMETPVSAFMKVSRGANAFLLESVEGGERIGRYSFIGVNPYAIFKSRGRDVEIIGRGIRWRGRVNDPLSALRDFMKRFSPIKVEGLPRFFGGAVGYVGYDMVRFFERLPETSRDPLGLPDSIFLIADQVLIFDHVTHKIKVVFNAVVEGDAGEAYDRAIEEIETLVTMLQRDYSIREGGPGDSLSAASKVGSPQYALRGQDGAISESLKRGDEELSEAPFISNVTKEGFEESVRRAKEYILAGDIFQVVLSQRFSTELRSHPFDLYRILRTINPSPYMFYLDFDEVKLVGSSPEVLVKLEDGIVELRPIAGTRPRGGDAHEDARLVEDLLADEKERAEHIMLVDLGRNDLGRVCEYGSVHVDELMTIEKYSHVMHIVSNIQGRLREGLDPFDVLRATFPAGTVSGAPKVRAMEIIEELEGERRGPYAGGVGYFSFSGNMDMCIAIRTIVVKGDMAFVQAGAGIVADSLPEKEYFETLNKARALLKAVKMANGIFGAEWVRRGNKGEGGKPVARRRRDYVADDR